MNIEDKHGYHDRRAHAHGDRVLLAPYPGSGWYDVRTCPQLVERHQELLGLTVDGLYGPKTRAAVVSRYGDPLTPLGAVWWCSRWGYDHAQLSPHYSKSWRRSKDHELCDTWHRLTGASGWSGAMMRLLTGYNGRSYSRWPCSAVTLDGLSVGIAHWNACTGNLARVGVDYQGPKVCGKVQATPDTTSLASWVLSQRDCAVFAQRQVDAWKRTYIARAHESIDRLGWSHVRSSPDAGRVLAGVARLCNSGKQGHLSKYRDLAPARALELVFAETGKPERWSKIVDWDGFRERGPWGDS